MKRLIKLALILGMIQTSAFATSLAPLEVAPVITDLEITRVEKKGVILKHQFVHPFDHLLIGIPVMVQLPSACHHFVGQETELAFIEAIRVKGVSDPMQDACIAIWPMPIDTMLTVKMKDLVGGIVPSTGIVQKRVGIGHDIYQITYNAHEQTVTIGKLTR